MKAPKLMLSCLMVLLASAPAFSGEEVDRLLAGYGKIETVTCQIRRTKDGELGKMTFLSRVYWSRDKKIHAEGISPIKRRTIADGAKLWQYVEGDPKGFSRPVADLSEEMTISLHMVPGTAMDQLLRLKGLEETALPPEGSTRRVGVQAGNQYILLLLDEQQRLTGLRFYKSAAMKVETARYDYSNFSEAVPGVWVPLAHEVKVETGETKFKETVKVDRFIANKPVAESLFIPSSFFDKEIDFVDDFAKIFDEELSREARGVPQTNKEE